MEKTKIKEFISNAQHSVSKHTPAILTGIGVAGTITTVILAVKATPKALELIEKEKEYQNQLLLLEASQHKQEDCNQINQLAPIEVVKVTWQCYIPAVVTGVASIACLIGASSVHMKRNAALATAYKIAETARNEYRDAVIETVGEKTNLDIKEKMAKNRVKDNPVSNNTVIVTPHGDALCYDHISGRYFRSSPDAIAKAENEINRKLISHDYVSLNELYVELGLEPLNVVGNDLGWNISKMPDRTLEIGFTAVIAEDGMPCLALDYNIAPYYRYDRYE